MVRILKNMRSRLVEDGSIEKGSAPSYFLEGLLALWYGERAIAYIRAHGVEVAITAVVLVLAGFVIYLRWPRSRATS